MCNGYASMMLNGSMADCRHTESHHDYAHLQDLQYTLLFHIVHDVLHVFVQDSFK